VFDLDLHALIETHGYWILVLGCLLEGETILLLAGFAASRGYLDITAVIAIAAVCGFTGDQIFFWFGRTHGVAVLARFPSMARKAEHVFRLIHKYQAWVVVGVRFAYGLRIAGPIIIGTSRISALRFMAFNGLGAIIWAMLVGGIGYVFGEAAQAMLGELHNIEIWLVLGLVGAASLVMLVQHLRGRAREAAEREELKRR
jgi:membrane protein DedA with SNARE-associated domain